jgi:hypothetical protein
MKLCTRCKCVIPQERLDILPTTKTCVQCSTVSGYLGLNVYDHKTAPRLVFVDGSDKEGIETLKRFANRARN